MDHNAADPPSTADPPPAIPQLPDCHESEHSVQIIPGRLLIPSFSEREHRRSSQDDYHGIPAAVSSSPHEGSPAAAKHTGLKLFRILEASGSTFSARPAPPSDGKPTKSWKKWGKVHPEPSPVAPSPSPLKGTTRKRGFNSSSSQPSMRRKTGRYRSTWSTALNVEAVTFETLVNSKDLNQQKGVASKATRLTATGQRLTSNRGLPHKLSAGSMRSLRNMTGILKDPMSTSSLPVGSSNKEPILTSSRRSLVSHRNKQLTFEIRSADDGRPSLLQQLPMATVKIILHRQDEIKFVCCVYEAVMVPVRLIRFYREGMQDRTCWACEARHSALPVVDALVDTIFTTGVMFTIYLKVKEARAWQTALRKNDSILLWGGKAYDNPLIQYFLSADFLIQWLLVVLLFWSLNSTYLPTVVFWTSQALRLPRACQIAGYLSAKELDSNVSIATVASAKFVLTVFLVIHWIGCVFYFLAIASAFQQLEVWQSWVPQFQALNNMYEGGEWTLDAAVGGQLDPYAYLLCLYKGLNVLTSLGYEEVTPRRYEELIVSIFAMFIQMVLEAYILGTLFHYLVKPDPLEEAFNEFMKKVDRYCANRHLPDALHKRLRAYFEFQHMKRRQDDSAVAEVLPHSLRVALASHLYGHLLRRNRFLLQDCNPQFNTMLLMELREVFLIPGGVIFHMGDMARELCFLTEGVVEKAKDGKVISTMYGVTDSSNMLGEVAFLMSVPHPYMAQAQKKSSATLLTLSRAAFDKLLAPYPEAYEQMMTNLLDEYDMDRKGNVQNVGRRRGVDETVLAERAEMVALIQGALAQRNADSMGSLKHAISVCKLEDVRRLLNEGFDITSADYDGRTILHLAAIAGDVKIVEMLVHDFDAVISATDRWGRLPIDDALAGDHSLVVNFLRENMGSGLGGSRYTRELCYAAASGDAEQVMRNMHNGMDCNVSLYDGRTPLHIAASRGHLKVTEFLLSKGAAINAEDAWGCTPLEDAVLNGHELMAHLLRFSGGKLGKKIRTDPGHAAMHLMTAVSNGDISKVKLMVENGISPNVCDYDLRSSVHIAASDGMLLSVAFLVEKCNCEVNPVDRWKKTPMQDALEAGHLPVAVLLRAYGGELGPSASPDLIHKLNEEGWGVPSVKDVRRQVNAMMLNQASQGMALKDMSNTDNTKQNQRVLAMLIPQLERVDKEVQLLREEIRAVEVATGPVLLMMVVALIQPGASMADKLFLGTGDGGSSKAKSAAGDGKGTHRLNSKRRNSTTESRSSGEARNMKDFRSSSLSAKNVGGGGGGKTEGQGRFVRVLLTFGDIGVHIKRLARIFFTGGEELHERIPALLNAIGVEFDDEILTELIETVVTMGDDREFGSMDFYKLLCTDAMHALVNSGGAPTSTPEAHLRLRHVREAMESLSFAWGCMSPDGEVEVNLNDISAETAQRVGKAGLEAMRDSLRDIGNPNSTLKKYTFLQLLMVMVGEADMDDSDDDDDGASMSDGQSESTLGPNLDDLMMGAGHVKGLTGQLVEKEDVHQELIDEINVLSGQAMSAIAAYDEYIAQRGWRGRLIAFLKYRVLRERRVEEMFANEIFNLLDEDCTDVLDDYELDILRKALLVKIQRSNKAKPGENDAENERLQDVKRVTLDIYNHIDNANSVQMRREEFIKFCRPLLTVWRDVDSKHKANAAAGNMAHAVSSVSSKLVLSPNSKWIGRWQLLNMLVAIFYFLDVPFRIAFHSLYCFGQWYLVLGIFCECVQLANIVVRFHTAYVNKNSVLITGLGKIRRHYLSHGFMRDFAASVPFDFFMVAGNGFSLDPDRPDAFYWLQPKVQGWLRLPRLFLIIGFFRWWLRRSASSHLGLLRQALRKLIPVLCALAHLMACAWWMVGTWQQWLQAESSNVERVPPVGRSWTLGYIGVGYTHDIMSTLDDCLTQYLLSLYWVATTLSTSGLVGDMRPATWSEVGFTCFAMLVSITLYAYVLGELSNAVMKKDELLVNQRSQLSLVQSFVKGRELPPELRAAILSQFENSVRSRGGSSGLLDDSAEEVVERLPHSLQVDVARCVSRGLVAKVEIMECCKDSFLDALSVLLKEKTMTRDGYLFRANEICDSLYIVWKGALEFVVEEEGEMYVTKTMEPGSVVGELSFFFGMKQTESARSKLNSPGASLFLLHHKDFKDLVRLYPSEEQVIVKQVLTLHKDRTALMQEHDFLDSGDNYLLEVQRSMEAAERKKRQQHVVDMVTAAADGDLMKLKGVMREHGLMVDEADYHGRTALHLSAANGHVNVVSWLVGTMRADVNVVDINGMSPLMEAVHFKQHEVAKYLRSRRATLVHDDKAGEICELASQGRLEDIKLLAENGFWLADVKDYDSRSPLHLAASKGHLELVKFLVKSGVNVNVRDRNDYTPLQDAMLNGHTEVVAYLRSVGGSIFSGEMAYRLCMLACNDDLNGMKALVEVGVDPNLADYDMRTALHLASCMESVMVATYLLNRTAGCEGPDCSLTEEDKAVDINSLDRYGCTPLDDAVRHDSAVMQSMLQRHSALKGADEALTSKHEEAKLAVEKTAAEQAETLAAEMLQQTAEMVLLECAAALRKQLKLVNETLHDQCQMFLNSARDLVKVGLRNKAWGPHQLVRVRRLNDVTRLLASHKKVLDREVELMLRRTNNLNMGYLASPRRNLKADIMHLQSQFRQTVTFMDTFVSAGRKIQFSFGPMRNKKNRVLLQSTEALKAYRSLAEQEVDVAGDEQMQLRAVHIWGQMQRRKELSPSTSQAQEVTLALNNPRWTQDSMSTDFLIPNIEELS